MRADQIQKLLTGNEMVAEAAKSINFHFMGYYPITPSTEIAQIIEAMKARGEVSTVMLPLKMQRYKSYCQYYALFIVMKGIGVVIS